MSMSGLEIENRRGLRSTTCRGDVPLCAGLVGGPSRKWYCVVCACLLCGVVCAGLRVLSLSRWRKVGLHLAL